MHFTAEHTNPAQWRAIAANVLFFGNRWQPNANRIAHVNVSPEERAAAVAERFAAELPSRSVPELERIVTSAIRRALAQQLAELEAWAERSSEHAHGRGKSAKGQDLAAARVHDEWANRFKRLRNSGAIGLTPG